ncbi:MAG: Gfo/Idh/MocA family oxidoreductase [Kiritimatiellae bacterium]|nr:Gfo/Idh/MocA family oxidoreductase [Kiritimatiellia bacterium]
MDKVKVGIIGCGNISGKYFKTMREVYSHILDVAACADLAPARARAKAAEYPGVEAMAVRKLLADPEIKIVVNLTIPKAHYKVAMQVLKAGKNVYSEKPLAITRAQGKKLLALAKEKNLLIGNAPDTFMGGGIQTCRKLIDDGVIGEPVAATAFVMFRGHEHWHPDPEFYYQVGGGPMFDMGPYYLTALVNLLGPVKRVTGSARISFLTRTITSAKKSGQVIPVEVPTHVAGIMDFAAGAVGTIITSFDVQANTLPCIQIYGSKATLEVPDPNGFGGVVKIRKAGEKEWNNVLLTHEADIGRGVGVADMACSILRPGRPHRASGELAFHVLDLMLAFHDSSAKGRHVIIESSCMRPPAVPAGLAKGELDK